MRPKTEPNPAAIPECRCLHGFGPYLVQTTPPFFDGAAWVNVPTYELRVCPAHARELPAPSLVGGISPAEMDGAAARVDQSLCALADVVDMLWDDDGPITVDEIAQRLSFLKPRGAK